MSKVVIHIGTHKTATTTIQDTFHKNSNILESHGVIYPHLGTAWANGRVTGHHGLVFNWEHMPEVYKLPQGSKATLAAIAEEYGASDKTVLLSSEEFSRTRTESVAYFSELRSLLKAFDEIEIVCVLRTQWQFLQSVYMELSKSATPPRVPRLVNPVIETGVFQGLWVDYNLLLDGLERVFSPNEITLLDYNTCSRAKDGILDVFLRHLGVKVPVSDLKSVNEGVSNVSAKPLAVWAANMLSEPRRAPPKLICRAEEILKKQYDASMKTSLFTADEFWLLQKHFDKQNTRLKKRRAKVQPEFSVSSTKIEDTMLFRENISAAFWVQFCRSLVAKPL